MSPTSSKADRSALRKFQDSDRPCAGEEYQLCGVRVAIGHEDSRLAEQLQRRWQELFVVTDPSSIHDGHGIRLQWSTKTTPQSSVGGQLLSDAGGLRVEKLAGGFLLDCGSARVAVDLASGVGSGVMTESFFDVPPDAQRRFLLLALVMLIRSRSRFALHAGGVAQDGRGCLIAGRSGSGKTTLGLSLIRQGWSNLSDDVVVLQDKGDGIDALGINRGFSCTMKTAQVFRGLLDCQDESAEKRIMQLSDATSQRVTRCRPCLILLPTIAEASVSRLIPVRPIEAVNELIQFSAGIMINRRESSEQLESLTRLVSQSSVLRFAAGRDVFDYPERVEQLIRQAIGE